ncbi:MAG TPA: hypothetical protein VFJ07_10795 [Streptosporangiaceae bacterium]|nr:hypothetical protein [Streptosporangiaceae bacterium]
MSSNRPSIRSILAPTAAKAVTVAAAGVVAAALSLTTTAGAATGGTHARSAAASSFSFNLVPSSTAISACLPHAGGHATITTGALNDVMKVTLTGMPHNIGFDLFVIQQPGAPFGVSWYQSDIQTDSTGTGSATVRGIFDKETFSVSPGGTTTFAPTHQFHLGVWFNNPNVPFNRGCEPGAPSAIVTPFNGEQHAGIQVVNTSNFPDDAGPLSQVTR